MKKKIKALRLFFKDDIKRSTFLSLYIMEYNKGNDMMSQLLLVVSSNIILVPFCKGNQNVLIQFLS